MERSGTASSATKITKKLRSRGFELCNNILFPWFPCFPLWYDHGLTLVIYPWSDPDERQSVCMPTIVKKLIRRLLRCYPKSLTTQAYRDDSEVHIQDQYWTSSSSRLVQRTLRLSTTFRQSSASYSLHSLPSAWLHIEHISRMVSLRPSSWVTESADDVLIAAADIFNRLLYSTSIIVISAYAVRWLLFQQWLLPGHRNIVQGNEPPLLGPISAPSTPLTSSHKSLSDYLFPRPSATNSIPIWTATNHEMFANLFHCIEYNTCAQNQTTGKHSNTILMRNRRVDLRFSGDPFFASI